MKTDRQYKCAENLFREIIFLKKALFKISLNFEQKSRLLSKLFRQACQSWFLLSIKFPEGFRFWNNFQFFKVEWMKRFREAAKYYCGVVKTVSICQKDFLRGRKLSLNTLINIFQFWGTIFQIFAKDIRQSCRKRLLQVQREDLRKTIFFEFFFQKNFPTVIEKSPDFWQKKNVKVVKTEFYRSREIFQSF